jgi:hypothetical protein
VITLASYDELATSVVTQRFDDAQILTFDPANTSGFVWDPLVLAGAQELAPLSTAPPSDEIPGDVAAYAFPVARIARAAGAVMIAGQPTITFVASTVAHRVQFNVRLFDVAGDGTKRLVTRGTTTLDTGNSAIPLGTTTVTIVTYGNVWSAAVPDKLRLEITNVDSPYLTPSRFPSVTQISDVRLNLPLR